MQIEVQETEYCKLKVHYESSPDEVSDKMNEVLSLFKKAPVKGFRPGKANIEVIKIQYRNQINESLKRALAETALHNTIFDKNLRPLGNPDFTSMLLSGSKFSCDFNLSVKPEFVLGTYKGIEVPNPVVAPINEIAEQIMQQIRSQYGAQHKYESDDFIQSGDIVIINYKAFDGEQALDTLSSDGETLTVGKSLIGDFDESLWGMKVGEVREFAIIAPLDSLPSLSGKSIKFVVELVSGSKMVPAALDDNLAKRLGQENFESLHSAIVQAASGRADLLKKKAITDQLSNKLVYAHDIKVPEWLSLPEAQLAANNAKVQWDILPDNDKARFITMGENNVKLSLILDKIRDEEPECQLSEGEVIEMLKETFSKSNPDRHPDELLKELGKNGYLQSLFVGVRDSHVLGYLAQHATIID